MSEERRKNYRNERNRKDNKKKNPKDGQQQKKSPYGTVFEKKKRPPINFTPPYFPRVSEPLEKCAICGETIQGISQALLGKEEGTFVHFDCVLELIRKEEHVEPPMTVSYIGRGTFAVIRPHEEDKGFDIINRIVWEDQDKFQAMKNYVEGRKK